jgi:DNA primase
MTFKEACQFLGKEMNYQSSTLAGGRTTKPRWEPRTTGVPGDIWQKRAWTLVEESELWLFKSFSFAPKMLKMLGWLKECRGLSEETIRAHRLGLALIPNRFEGHEKWGLEPVFKDAGTPKKIWIPRGLTIPLFQDGKIYRIRIRRPKFALRSERDPRYYLLRGSNTQAMVLGTDKPVSIIVESELDALLLHQEAGDLVNVISLGNAQSRPDKEAADLLQQSRLILLALDADAAGGKESWQWWKEHYSQARRWPPVAGKDPGDMLAAGINTRTWIEAGLIEYKDSAAQPEDPLPLTRVAEEPVIEEHHETAPPSTPVTLSAVPATTSPDSPESSFICAECPHFQPNNGQNPRQGWGRCLKRNKGRFGCAAACEAAQTDDGVGPNKLSDREIRYLGEE